MVSARVAPSSVSGSSRRASRRTRRSSILALARAVAPSIDIDEADWVAMLEGELGDPGAHRAGADHGDLNRHRLSRP